MSRFARFRTSTWRIPIVSGVLIAAALALPRIGAWNVPLSQPWWLDAGHHSTSGPFTITDLLMLAAALVAGGGTATKAVRALRTRIVSINLLVTLAALGAILIGNFWEAAAVTFLFAIGNALEAATLNRTRSALADLIAVAPETALVLRNGEQVEIPTAHVEIGETVLIKNGAQVPVDGEVLSGAGAVDESTITGESIPAAKSEGSPVYAGTISHGGFLEVRANAVGQSTTLARIIRRVEDAQEAKAQSQSLIERFSRWYTPGVIALAVIAGLLSGDVVLALTLLVIGCPGALVISIPVAIVAGIGNAARRGILIKGGEYLETAAKISAVAIDKTGTLTEGRPALTDVVGLDPTHSRAEILRWAAAAELGSEHPLARPIIDAARTEGIELTARPDGVVPVPGKGVLAEVAGRAVLVGNAALLAEHADGSHPLALDRAAELAAAGVTPVIVALDSHPIGILGVADQVRPRANEIVPMLHDAGVRRVVMLTGDAPEVAAAIARTAGIEHVRAGLLPEDKRAAVQELQAEGFTVAMVGDGVNDAPALATADSGVAMGAAGSAVAIETADIALMSDDLRKLPEAIRIARRTRSVMRQNMAIALATVVILLTGVFGGSVTMSIGMLVHEASVLIVILNAMRLLRSDRPRLGAGVHLPVEPLRHGEPEGHEDEDEDREDPHSEPRAEHTEQRRHEGATRVGGGHLNAHDRL
ncbi:Cd2+/Zn2+-exporting ATPase [Ruaniaceae bacterium KH17]|nr:Cd2+/Zn2+-exporting ATPase [Ruaniaceae bacterium KH17]